MPQCLYNATKLSMQLMQQTQFQEQRDNIDSIKSLSVRPRPPSEAPVPAASGGGGVEVSSTPHPPRLLLPISGPGSSDRVSSIQLDGSDSCRRASRFSKLEARVFLCRLVRAPAKEPHPLSRPNHAPGIGEGRKMGVYLCQCDKCVWAFDSRGDLKGEPCIGLDELFPEEVRHP